MKQPELARAQIAQGARTLELHLSPAQVDLLLRFESLLRTLAVPQGVVGPGESDRLADRHIVDSLRAAAALRPTDSSAYDLGSGAGLPGVVVGIARPDLAVTLVEARRRRVAFLERAVADLELNNVTVSWSRVEDASGRVDACFARAFASVERSWEAARPLLVKGGRLAYFAGPGARIPEHLPGASAIDQRWELESGGPLVIIRRL